MPGGLVSEPSHGAQIVGRTPPACARSQLAAARSLCCSRPSPTAWARSDGTSRSSETTSTPSATLLNVPRARDAQHARHASRVPAASPRQPACRVSRARQVSPRPAQRLGLDHKPDPGGSADDMVEIPAAWPVDGVANLPAVARELLELAPHQRLRLSADPAPGGHTEGMTACQGEHARHHHKHQRPRWLAHSGGQYGGHERHCRQRAARRRPPEPAQLLSTGIRRDHGGHDDRPGGRSLTAQRPGSVRSVPGTMGAAGPLRCT